LSHLPLLAPCPTSLLQRNHKQKLQQQLMTKDQLNHPMHNQKS
jgi:hypothetical protein